MFTAGVSQMDDSLLDAAFGVAPAADATKADPKPVDKLANSSADSAGDGKGPGAQAAPAKQDNADVDANLDSDVDPLDIAFGTKADTTVDANDQDQGKDPKATPAKKATSAENIEVDFEAMYNYMVDKKIWNEVTLPDDVEWNEETYLLAQKLQVTSEVEAERERTGPYGKKIMEYEQNGGPVKELLKIFAEQETIQDFDISEADGQETFLRAYLENQGASEKSIDRTIEGLKNQGAEALKEEAEERKALWDAEYKEGIEAELKAQKERAEAAQRSVKEFQKKITESLTADTSVSLKERRELQNYLLNYSNQLGGKPVTQFYADTLEIQKNPEQFIELAKFVKGLKDGSYKKKIESQAKKETQAATFMKIKNGNALKVTSGDKIDVQRNDNSGVDFASLFTKKKR